MSRKKIIIKNKQRNNCLLSYPRSGNSLVRFFIEFLSQTPTNYGWIEDGPLYRKKILKDIPFEIKNFDKNESFHKSHGYEWVPHKKLIFLLRNPREVLIRDFCGHSINISSFNCENFESYFKLIDDYQNYNGKKIIFFYEDILTNKEKFVKDLYNFLEVNNKERLQYTLENIDKLYDFSAKDKGKVPGAIRSDFSTNYYYPQIPLNIKPQFDKYIDGKFKKYKILNDKYN